LASSTRVAQLLLKYIVDPSSVSKSTAASKQVEDSLRNVNTSAFTASQSATELEKSLARIARAKELEKLPATFRKLVRETGDWDAAIQQLQKRLKELGATSGEMDQVAGSITSRKGITQNSITRIGNEMRMLPSVAGSDSIANVVRLLGALRAGAIELGLSLTTVLGIVGALTIAIAAVAVVMNTYNTEIERQKRFLNSQIEAQQMYFAALRDNSTGDTIRQVEELTHANEILGKQIEETKASLETNFANTVKQMGGDVLPFFGDAVARASDKVTNKSGALQESLQKLEDQYNTNQTAIERLTSGRGDETFAANEAAKVNQIYKESLVQSTLQVENMTEAQRKAALMQNRATQQIIEGWLNDPNNMEPSGSPLREQMVEQITQLKAQAEILAQPMETYADWLLHQKEQLDGINNAAQLAIKLDGMTREEREKYVQQLQFEAEALRQNAMLVPGITEDNAKAIDKQIAAYNWQIEAITRFNNTFQETSADYEAARKAQEDADKAAVNGIMQYQSARMQANKMTQDERDKEITELDIQIASLHEMIRVGGNNTDVTLELVKAMDELIHRKEILEGVTWSLGDALKQLEEREKAQIDLLKQTNETMDDLAKAETGLEKARQDMIDATAEHQDQLNEIERKRQNEVAEADRKRQKAEGEARTKAAVDLAEDLEQIERDSNEKIKELRHDANRDIREMIAKGDQAGALRRLEDAEDAIQKEEQQAAKAEIEKRKEIQKRLDEQLAAIKDSYDEQVLTAQRGADEQIYQENRKWERERQIRQHAIDQAIVDVMNLNNAIYALNQQRIQNETNTLQSVLGVVVGKGSEIVGAFNNWLNQILAGLGGPGTVPPPSPPGGPIAPIPPGGGEIPPGAPLNPTPGQVYKDWYGQWWVWTGNHWQKGYTQGQSANTANYSMSAASMSASAAFSPTRIPSNELINGGGMVPLPTVGAGSGSTYNTGSKNVIMNLQGWQGDAKELAGLVKRVINSEKPVIVREVAMNMAKVQAEEDPRYGGRR
jgi:peptidoglycan hydrolase-like protein with peptidoglycan-binding domain